MDINKAGTQKSIKGEIYSLDKVFFLSEIILVCKSEQEMNEMKSYDTATINHKSHCVTNFIKLTASI